MSFLIQVASQARQMRSHSVTKPNMVYFGPMPKLYFRVISLALLLSFASGDCVDLDLGMENKTIKDSRITADSVYNASTPAKNGRLDFASASSWCAKASDPNPYLQIDLQTLHIICAVSTQGNSQADQWVTNYKLKMSTDGSTWTDYKEDGQAKSFEGNNDKNSKVKHVVYGVLTRYLRFLPKAYQGSVCMRTEVFGIKQKPENLALGKTATQSLTSGSSWNAGNAVDGNENAGHCSKTLPNNPSWWQVDLGANLVPVSEINIVNMFDAGSSVANSNYKITFGGNSTVANNPQCEGLYSFINFRASAVCFMNPLKTGRYVGIMTTTSQILQLCEVEVYSRENLAFGKPTSQYYSKYKKGYSSKAVDGNSNTHFLYGGPAGSCTMTYKSVSIKPWWRVDLQQDEHVSEVYIVNRGSECGCPRRFKNFEIRVGTVKSSDSTANPKCGDTYTYSFPVGEGKSFFCHPSLKGRYVVIRLLDKNKLLTLCEVEVYSERRACPMQSIGVVSSDAFPDNSFSASSASSGNKASKGRLNGVGAWSPSTDNDANDYLQINLQYEFVICAVATQGKSSADEWTEEYKLRLSLDGTNWVTYQENSIDKVFNGNSGKNDIVKHSLKRVVSARFIRFQPTKFNTHKALRVEVYGVLLSTVPSQAPSDFRLAPNNSTSITASWQLPPEYARHGTITGFKLFYRKKDAGESLIEFTINNNGALSRVVAELQKYTEYEFQVLAVNSNGDGRKSTMKVERTEEDVPSKPPTTFKVTASTSTSIKVSWELPPADSRNGIITGFKLYYKKRSSSSSTMLLIEDGNARTYNVTRLAKYTEYKLQVLAFTSVGDGPKKSLFKRTDEGVPSQPPNSFSVTAKSSTSISASWQSPPADSWNGIIKGFKLLYQKKGASGPATMVLINSALAFTDVVTGLAKYTEYELQVLAFTSVGDGTKSTKKFRRTLEDAPSAPASLSYIIADPTESHGPRIKLTWSRPAEENGIIRNYNVFHSHNGDAQRETFGSDALSYIVDVLGGVTYQFHVRAVTIKPGPNVSRTVVIPEYKPSSGPLNVSFSLVNKTTFNISWAALKREKSNGKVILYDVRKDLLSRGKSQKGSLISSRTVNTPTTFVVLYELPLCSRYNVSVRAYTIKGPGPYSRPVELETSKLEGPGDLKITNYGTTHVMLEWKGPKLAAERDVIYTVKFSGVKSYGKSFKDEGVKKAQNFTCKVVDLVPGSSYTFEVYGTSVCDKSSSAYVKVETKIKAPIAPVVLNLSKVTVSGLAIGIYLWPAEQRNGPISAYQVIVLKVVDGAEDLPNDYDSKLKDDASKDNLNFYIAAEIGNNPVRVASWEFNVGDDKKYGTYENKQLEKGENYVVYQRAVTYDKNVTLEGDSSRVARISITPREAPIIIKDISPTSVICEKQTLCLLSCYANSDSPFNYSWTKNGQVPLGHNIKVVNNNIVLTPRDAKDYGVYVCHASNSFGSTAFSITLTEGLESSLCAERMKGDNNANSIFSAAVIVLSCIVFVLLVVIGVLIWRLRRAVPNNRTTADKAVKDGGGKPELPRDQHVTEPGSYMELLPMLSEGQTRAPPEYTSPKGANKNPEYYNVEFSGNKLPLPRDQQMSEPASYMELQPRPLEGQSRASSDYKGRQGTKNDPGYYNVRLNKESSGNEREEIYDEIGNAHS